MKNNVFSLFLVTLCFFHGQALCEESIGKDQLERIDIIEKNADNLDVKWHFELAKHYYFKDKCYRKAMFWALKGAENGSSECMLLLRVAYGHGLGVIQDTEECLKWLVLAATIGNEEAQKEVKNLESQNYKIISHLPDAEFRSLIREHELQWKEVRKMAKAWADAHQSLFFSQH